MPCGFSGDTGTRVTTNRTQWPPSGSTTRTCPSRSRSTSRVGSRGSVTVYSYHNEATHASESDSPLLRWRMAVGPLNSLKKVPLPSSAGWERKARNPKPTNHLRAPDGVAFPLPSNFRRWRITRKQHRMAQIALISLVNSQKAPAGPSGESRHNPLTGRAESAQRQQRFYLAVRIQAVPSRFMLMVSLSERDELSAAVSAGRSRSTIRIVAHNGPRGQHRCAVALHNLRRFRGSLADSACRADRVGCGNYHGRRHTERRATEGRSRTGSAPQVTRGGASPAHSRSTRRAWFPHKAGQQDGRTDHGQDGGKPVADARSDHLSGERAQDRASRKRRHGRGHRLWTARHCA